MSYQVNMIPKQPRLTSPNLISIDAVDIAEEHLVIAKEQLRVQRDWHQERLAEKERECHQLFRLTKADADATYEWYKDRVAQRVEGTCLWFLKHDNYREWLEKDSGPLLVTADCGCGKSVLAKYLIDEGLPRSASICYYFFKDQDQNTVRQALCAILHQIFTSRPCLIEHAMAWFIRDGDNLVNSTASLWEVLQGVINDSRAESIIIVLDALDECAEQEIPNLVKNIERQFYRHASNRCRVKYLMTCRPYEQVISGFSKLFTAIPNIRIPGEEESEAISEEVSRVIEHRANHLSERYHLPPNLRVHLIERLRRPKNRTYLWVYLVFDYLETTGFKKTSKGIDHSIDVSQRVSTRHTTRY
jgi:hypothetical protein